MCKWSILIYSCEKYSPKFTWTQYSSFLGFPFGRSGKILKLTRIPRYGKLSTRNNSIINWFVQIPLFFLFSSCFYFFLLLYLEFTFLINSSCNIFFSHPTSESGSFHRSLEHWYLVLSSSAETWITARCWSTNRCRAFASTQAVAVRLACCSSDHYRCGTDLLPD